MSKEPDPKVQEWISENALTIKRSWKSYKHSVDFYVTKKPVMSYTEYAILYQNFWADFDETEDDDA